MKMKMWSLKVAAFIGIVVGVFGFHLQAQAYSGFWVKDDAEYAMGQRSLAARAGQSYQNPLVTELAQKVIAANGLDFSHYTFQGLRTNEINADCAPGKNIWVWDGFISFVNGDKEIISYVLAHEVGHAANRHWLKTINKRYTNAYGAALLGKAIAPNSQQIQSFLLTQSQIIVLHGYGLDKEWEADAFAQSTVEKMSDVNLATGLVYFRRVWIMEEPAFAKMTAQQRQAQYINPHPPSPERWQYVSKRINEYSGGKVGIDYDGTVWLNKNRIFKPVNEEGAIEQAYWMAGWLARVVHDLGFNALLFKADDSNVFVITPGMGSKTFWVDKFDDDADDVNLIMAKLKIAGAKVIE